RAGEAGPRQRAAAAGEVFAAAEDGGELVAGEVEITADDAGLRTLREVALARGEARGAGRPIRLADRGRVVAKRLILIAADDLPETVPTVVLADDQVVRSSLRVAVRVLRVADDQVPLPVHR